MEIQTSYSFDGDAQVSEVAAFLRDRFMDSGGWDITVGRGPADSVEALGGYSSGKLRFELVEEFDAEDES